MIDTSILARLQRLEDVEAIDRLKTMYCFHCDNDFDADAIAGLFSEDATWDGGLQRGRHVGRKAIRDFLDQNKGRIPFAAHLLCNPLIDVNGDCARGRWRMLMPHNKTTASAPGAHWLINSYDDDFVRRDGRWYISVLRVQIATLDPQNMFWSTV